MQPELQPSGPRLTALLSDLRPPACAVPVPPRRLVTVDREIPAVHVHESIFHAVEGGAELGDQFGQVGDEPAPLDPLRGGSVTARWTSAARST